MKFVLALALAALAASPAHADPAQSEYHVYARSNLQSALRGEAGSDDLNTGWGAHNRLQEGQYFELTWEGKPMAHTDFVATLSSGSTSYPYDNSIGALNPTGGSWFNVRNLYLQYDGAGDSNDILWFGARMFRGDTVYLFDSWPLDDHDMIGGGYTHKMVDSDFEFDIGVNKDSAYGVPGNSVPLSGSGSPTFTSNTQRYLLIQKYETKIGDERKFKTNLEFQYLPGGIGTDAATGANNGLTFTIPADYGVQAGAQANLWRGNTTVVNYGYGNVVGNWGSTYLNIVGVAVTPTSGTGVSLTDVNAKKYTNAQAGTIAFYGDEEYDRWALLYGEVPKYARTAGGNTGVVNTIGARPMYFAGPHLHVGGEVDWVVFPKHLNVDASEVNYVEVTPIVEYALTKNAYGTPKFFFAPSSAFYASPVTKDGMRGRYAFNATLGMELWF